MDSYIVRVYRRPNAESRSLLGVIESVEQQEKHVFRSLDELWDVLNSGCALSRNGAGERDLKDLLKEVLGGASAVQPVHQHETRNKTKANGNEHGENENI